MSKLTKTDNPAEPWFIAKDVCDVLGIRVQDAHKSLDADEVDTIYLIDSVGRNQEQYILNEPGLCSLILRSRKQEAVDMFGWIGTEFGIEELEQEPVVEQTITSAGCKIFRFKDKHPVRVVEQDGQSWFLAKDVCDILGYAGDAGQATRYLDADEKTTLMIQQDGSKYKSNQVLVNEPGLYSLILRSRVPAAKEFKRWVIHEVQP